MKIFLFGLKFLSQNYTVNIQKSPFPCTHAEQVSTEKIKTHTLFRKHLWKFKGGEKKQKTEKYQAAIISIRGCAEIQGERLSRAKNHSFSTLQCPKPPSVWVQIHSWGLGLGAEETKKAMLVWLSGMKTCFGMALWILKKKKCALIVKLLPPNIVINYKIHLLELCSVTFHCC